MTPKEYELFTKLDFEKRLKTTFKEPIFVKHLQKLVSPDGIEHEVDLHYEFEIDGMTYLNIIECKFWNKKVTREMVKAFKSVREDLRAHKAIIVTNHGYQSGAVEYAKIHGISLIKLTRREREVWAHFDGGLSTIEQTLIAEPDSRELSIHDDMELVGFFYPNDEALANYLVKKFGKKFALYLIDKDDFGFDIDDMISPIPDELVKGLEFLNDDWYKDYNLIETAGLNFKLDTESLFRSFNIKITMLKMHIEMRKNA